MLVEKKIRFESIFLPMVSGMNTIIQILQDDTKELLTLLDLASCCIVISTSIVILTH